MTEHRMPWSMIGAGIALTALLLLAMGLEQAAFMPASPKPSPASLPGPAGTFPPGAAFVFVALMGIALIVFFALFLRMLVRRRGAPEDELVKEEQKKSSWPALIILIAVGGLLAGGLQIALQLKPREVNLPSPERVENPPTASSQQPPSQQMPGEQQPAKAPLEPLLRFWVFLLIAALLGLVVLLLWRWRASRVARVKPPALSEGLAQRAGKAAQELEQGGDLKDVVLRCYRDMCLLFGKQHRITLTLDMTAREFRRALQELGIADEHVDRLTGLFERVRYGGWESSEAERRLAIASFQAIDRQYGALKGVSADGHA